MISEVVEHRDIVSPHDGGSDLQCIRHFLKHNSSFSHNSQNDDIEFDNSPDPIYIAVKEFLKISFFSFSSECISALSNFYLASLRLNISSSLFCKFFHHCVHIWFPWYL